MGLAAFKGPTFLDQIENRKQDLEATISPFRIYQTRLGY